jgi:hypothetical protein
MADFLGITKRKWLAFAILSAIFAAINAIIASAIAQSILHRPANIVGGILVVFIATLVLASLADALLGKFKEMLNVRIPKRYLAAIVFGVVIALYPGSNPQYNLSLLDRVSLPLIIIFSVISMMIGFVVLLVLYTLSDFLAGLVFPAVAAKTKSKEKKSRN